MTMSRMMLLQAGLLQALKGLPVLEVTWEEGRHVNRIVPVFFALRTESRTV